MRGHLLPQHYDRHGLFVRFHPDARPLEEIEDKFAVFFAPPRHGKSYSARALAEVSGLPRPNPWDGNIANLEPVAGDLWILDAFDESLRKCQPSESDIDRIASALVAAAEGKAVRIFARHTPEVEQVLRAMRANVVRWSLAPIDRQAALGYLGNDKDALDRALERILTQRIPLASRQPELLKRFADNSEMKFVLRDIAASQMAESGKLNLMSAPSDTLMRMAFASATVAHLSSNGFLSTEIGCSEGNLSEIARIIDRNTGQELLKQFLRSGVVRTTRVQNPEIREFVDLHTQELFCAFGLEAFSLPRLKSVLTKDGILRSDCREVARYLRQISQDCGVQVWLSDTLSESAMAFLAAFATEMRSTGAEWATYDIARDLSREDAEHALEPRLRERSDPPAVMARWARVAIDLESERLAKLFGDIACDPTVDDRVRISALYAVAHAGDQNTRRSALASIRSQPIETEEHASATAAVITSCVLERTIDPFEGLFLARDLGGKQRRRVAEKLEYAVARMLSIEHARRLADVAGSDWDLLATFAPDSELIWDRLEELLCTGEQRDPDDLARVAHVIVVHPLSHFTATERMRKRLAIDAQGRRLLFERAAGTSAYAGLLEEDFEWLRERVNALGRNATENDLKWLYDLGSTDVDARSAAEQARPGWWEAHHHEQRVRASDADAMAAKYRSELERANARRRNFSEVARDLLSEPMAPEQRLHQLALLIFQAERFRRISGRFGDAPMELRHTLRDALYCALETATPTPIPIDGGPFPESLLLEAKSFTLCVHELSNTQHLAESLFDKWLPTLFFARNLEPDDDVMTVAFEGAPGVSTRRALEAIRRELEYRDHPHCAAGLPDIYWSDPLLGHGVSKLCEASEYLGSRRSALLGVLCVRSPDVGRQVVESRLREVGSVQLTDVDLGLAMCPDLVWPLLRDAVHRQQADALRALESVRSPTSHPRATIALWPIERRVELCRWIYDLVPKPDRPSGEIFSPTPDDALHDVYSATLHGLLPEATEDDPRLDQIRVHPIVAAWLVGKRTEARNAKSPWQIPFAEIIAVLRDPDHRILLDAAHLRDVVLEELGAIADTMGHDEPLLMGRTEEQDSSASAKREEDLSLYLRRRLADRLQSKLRRAGMAETDFEVERQVVRQGRLDISITGRSISGEAIRVVIEVKWSHHREVRKALESQLAVQYMKDDPELVHGIYLVGWSGRGHSSRAALARELSAQAEQWTRTNPGRSITSLVLPIAAEIEKRNKNSKARRAQRGIKTRKCV